MNKYIKLLNIIRCYQTNYQKIRVGKDNDGGYILPKDFGNVDFVISAGIFDDVSFDSFFADRQINVYQYDPTIDTPPKESKFFHFNKKPFGRMGSIEGATIDSIINDALPLNQNTGNIILKCDVEGSEYNAILRSSNQALSSCKILCAEFHYIHTIDIIENYNVIFETFRKISQNFFPFHIHINNAGGFKMIDGLLIPSLLEITFLNHSSFEHSGHLNMKGLDMAVDMPNILDKPQIPWNPAWYTA